MDPSPALTERPQTAAFVSPEIAMAFVLRLRGRGVRDLAVLRAMEMAPRALFLPQRQRGHAFRDMALPIGCGQTTAQPSIIAVMLEALSLDADCDVLEIGSGTGYATALLAQIARRVAGAERYRGLALEAGARLMRLGYSNARVAWADGLAPPDSAARFSRILVHACALEPPAVLLAQLATPGVMVFGAPGPRGAIMRLRREAHGDTLDKRGACRLGLLEHGVSLAL